MLMPEFTRRRIDTGEVALHVAVGGSGPPIVLLHGFPETHLCWHAVAPRLATRFTVVCPDLRGYGESDKPEGDATHERYSKRVMARDMLTLMNRLGHTRFAVAGHDRGAVVGFRLAMDHADAVSHLALMSVIPPIEQWASLSGQLGLAAYHLYLLAQPSPFPERLIGCNPDLFLTQILDGWSATPDAIVDEARAAYQQAFRDPRTIHAICEDYRANAGLDVHHDAADRDAGRKVVAPLLAMWEQPEGVQLPFDPLGVWRRWADNVQGQSLTCGHFLPEERPVEVSNALAAFFGESSASGTR